MASNKVHPISVIQVNTISINEEVEIANSPSVETWATKGKNCN